MHEQPLLADAVAVVAGDLDVVHLLFLWTLCESQDSRGTTVGSQQSLALAQLRSGHPRLPVIRPERMRRHQGQRPRLTFAWG
jgi:hypothetical protein